MKIAIETALGGNIQNIVTEDEETAKTMIDFLKREPVRDVQHFLPLTSVAWQRRQLQKYRKP